MFDKLYKKDDKQVLVMGHSEYRDGGSCNHFYSLVGDIVHTCSDNDINRVIEGFFGQSIEYKSTYVHDLSEARFITQEERIADLKKQYAYYSKFSQKREFNKRVQAFEFAKKHMPHIQVISNYMWYRLDVKTLSNFFKGYFSCKRCTSSSIFYFEEEEDLKVFQDLLIHVMTYQKITDPFEGRLGSFLDENSAYVFRSVEKFGYGTGLTRSDMCELLVTLQGRFYVDNDFISEPVRGRFDFIYIEDKEDAKMLRLKGKVADVEFTLVKSPEAEPVVI